MRALIELTWDGAPAGEDERVSLAVRRDGDHLVVTVDAPFHSDPPPSGPPGPTDRLWEHEVVELFVLSDRDVEQPRYTEIELGPHGHHLVLQLEGVRRVVRSGLPARYTATRAGDRWRGEARIDASLLPPPPHRMNAYAIHGAGDARRYLALYPGTPGPQPDFHRLEAFRALEL